MGDGVRGEKVCPRGMPNGMTSPENGVYTQNAELLERKLVPNGASKGGTDAESSKKILKYGKRKDGKRSLAVTGGVTGLSFPLGWGRLNKKANAQPGRS